MSTPSTFWEKLDRLMGSSEIIIDRPKGTAHPRYPDDIYPLDYGYLAGTTSGDGDGIDVWLGSLPNRHLTGVICIIDTLKRDSEIKLLLGCTTDEMDRILARHNVSDQGGLLIRRI
jgi:inorganic pyrophosphatase